MKNIKRDFNILLSQKGEIALKTSAIKSKKLYDRRKLKLNLKKEIY